MLSLQGVVKKYEDFALDCSIDVPSGMVVGLIGKNSAGKSTTFKAILDLIQLDKGDIVLFDKPHSDLNKADKEQVGVVLSDSGFSGYLTVQDVCKIMKAMYEGFQEKDFIQKCKAFEVPMNKKIKEFSTGMKAKLKIICAITHRAKLLILDEPTAGLDVIARDELLDILRTYMEENEACSILISSHISSDLEGLCDDVYLIDKGRIILHEQMDLLLDGYGILKVEDEKIDEIDRQFIIKTIKEHYGYRCLTNQKQFYLDNYPDVVVEKGNIDDIIMLMVKGA